MEDTNPKTKFGLQKAQLHLSPSTALDAMAGAFTLGAQKYGAYNWRERTVSTSTYVSAAKRHIDQYFERQNIDPESGHHHLGHAMACLAILIDADAFGCLIDDRPKVGRYARAEAIRPMPEPQPQDPLPQGELPIKTVIIAGPAKYTKIKRDGDPSSSAPGYFERTPVPSDEY